MQRSSKDLFLHSNDISSCNFGDDVLCFVPNETNDTADAAHEKSRQCQADVQPLLILHYLHECLHTRLCYLLFWRQLKKNGNVKLLILVHHNTCGNVFLDIFLTDQLEHLNQRKKGKTRFFCDPVECCLIDGEI
jgi:hypothetical protein